MLASASPLVAGTVDLIGVLPESNGKLALSGTTVLAGDQSTVINFPDILEANFADTPLNLKYFSSDFTPDAVPADWKSHDIGRADIPGSFTYAKGLLTLTGSIRNQSKDSDPENSYLLGAPWPGNCELSMHVQNFFEQDNPNPWVDLLLREGLDSVKGMVFHLGVAGNGGSTIFKRGSSGGNYGVGPPLSLPVWLRISHIGCTLTASSSTDGKDWEVLNQTNDDQIPADLYAGFGVQSEGNPPGKFKVDHITFTPGPSTADVLPKGVLLTSGTFLCGDFWGFDLTTTPTPTSISLHRNGKDIPMPVANISAITVFPTKRKQLAAFNGQTGLLMKNGDFNAGDIAGYQPGDPDLVQISTVQLGIINSGERFGMSGNLAVIFRPEQPQPADYEVRLTDGSIINAKGLTENKGQVQIDEVSGLSFTVEASEIAQLRAGTARVQNLAELPWQLETDAALKSSAKSDAAAKPSDHPAVTADSTGSATPTPDRWGGNNQEQIMSVPAGSVLKVPVADGVHDIFLHVAVSPHSTTGGQASIRIMADGQKTVVTPPMRLGDAPLYVATKFENPHTISFAVDSATPGMQVMLIDPVAVRSLSPPSKSAIQANPGSGAQNIVKQ